MAKESGFDTGLSYCGNCGTPVELESRVCGSCGHPVQTASGVLEPPYVLPSPASADYIPYCRSCGVGVPWGEGHTCIRCGVSPLCTLHFRASDRLCFDCIDAPGRSQASAIAGGLRCGSCGASAARTSEFCPNCGRAMASSRAGVEYMGFWIRLAAFAVDRIISYLIAAGIAAAIGLSRTTGEVDPAIEQEVTIALETINYSFLLLVWGISTVYNIVLTTLRGQTLGKMLFGIQVVDSNGNIPPWHRVIVRELVGKSVSELILWLGYIWIGFDQSKRGWHDYLGSSYVVRKRRGSRPASGIF